MNILQAIILGIVQGATEFIPVSSSAHLVLVPWLLRWPSPGLAFDTVLHLGTLLAVIAVFWRDLLALAAAGLRSAAAMLTYVVRTPSERGGGPASVHHSRSEAPAADTPRNRLAEIVSGSPEARLAWWIILGTIPAALMGALWESQFEALFGSPIRVAVLLLVTGVWLVLAERVGRKERQAEDLRWWQSLLVGVAQGCAIAPGISRSGATIGAGLFLGLRREAATRFSFLLATPIILGAGLLQIKKLLESSGLHASLLPLTLGFLAAFVAGYACIRFLLGYVRSRGLSVFAIYCWVAGLAAIAFYLLK
jgi:undecaprenyl-diphosphatase